jgi:hypothetical protein
MAMPYLSITKEKTNDVCGGKSGIDTSGVFGVNVALGVLESARVKSAKKLSNVWGFSSKNLRIAPIWAI